MIEEIESKGIWWIPGQRKKIIGKITFSKSAEADLELYGIFNNFEPTLTLNIPVIYGRLNYDDRVQDITLYNCRFKDVHFHIPEVQGYSFKIDKIIIGQHLRNPEKTIYNKVCVNYKYIDDWIGPQFENYHCCTGDIVTKILYPKDFQSAKIDDYIINLEIGFSSKQTYTSNIEFSLKQNAIISFSSSKGKSLQEYIHFINLTRNFLAFCTGKPIYITSLSAKTNKTIVEILFFHHNISTYDSPFVCGVLGFQDVSNQFGTYLKNWIKKSDQLMPVYDLYLSTLYSPEMYPYHYFLNLIQALETYHRRISLGKYQSDEEYSENLKPLLINCIESATIIDKDFKECLIGRTCYLNEYSLRRRLKDIYSDKKISNYLKNKIIDIKNQKYFIDQVVSVRNYLTHYDEELKQYMPETVDLNRISYNLKILLEGCLLKEIGILCDDTKT